VAEDNWDYEFVGRREAELNQISIITSSKNQRPERFTTRNGAMMINYYSLL
jgi:hypothetical protein